MKPVATINGVPVYSDKRVTGVVNTRVQFGDGSYADVSTMEVVNKGEGFITLKSPPGESAVGKPVTKTESFKASRLSIADIDAVLDIQPGGTEIVVTVTGPKSATDDISIKKEGDQLVVRGSGSGSGGSVVMSGGSVVIGNISVGSFRSNNVSISVGDGEPAAKVTIKVPVGTAMDISGVSGEAVIGDTLGALVLNQRGQSKARVGRVRAAQLLASGQSEIRVAEVQETLTVNASGQSEIEVRGGKVANLVATTSGQSEFTYEGSAVDATLTASGQSEIEVENIINKPVRSRSGQAEITVRNRD